MTREQWEQAKEIFSNALELEPGERESFARRAAKGDPDLAGEILRLLQEAERDSDLFSRPALAEVKAVAQEEPPRFSASAVLARRFRIARFIARGGMGEVYEADDLDLGERVALKAIRPHVAADPDLRTLFKREVQLARRVTHPNVCRIFDLAQHEEAGHPEPILLLSMELLEGQPLAEYLRVNGPLTIRGAMALIEEVAAGLQAVHDAGIIHGDLKPGNVMLVTNAGETTPHARVMDFGMALPNAQASTEPMISRPLSNDGSSVNSTLTVRPEARDLRGGTPDYFAPEQTRGARATTATDIYAFALVIAEMLGMPRANRSKPDAQHMPKRWARILMRCLAEDPARRYTRPADVAEALRAAIDRKGRAKRAALIAAFSVLGILLAAKRIDFVHGTTNHLLLTEGLDFTVQAPSPDGKYFAGTSWDTGDLVLREVSTGKSKRLTHKNTTWNSEFGGVYGAIFSRDGRQIAYVWSNSRTDEEIRLIGINGKSERTLYHKANTLISLLDWSADGKQILATLEEIGKESQLAVLSLQGSAQLVEKPAVGPHALFGPDGRSIVFDAGSAKSSRSEIHRLSAEGTETTLVGRTGSNSIIGWSPDGRRLIFASDRRGQPGIWAVPVSQGGAEGEPREVAPNANNWESLAVTSSGSLFYRHRTDSVDVYTAVLDLAAGRTISPPRRVTERFVGSFAEPNWSEDGQLLVFRSHRDPLTAELDIYEPQTEQMRELRLDLASIMRPQWVEHGAAIDVSGRTRDGQTGHFRINPRTGEVKLWRSYQELETVFEGAWSPDGKFHFNRFQDFRRGIYRLNIETGERRVIYVPPQGTDIGQENLALSPDGRMLAFHARKQDIGTLMVMPAEGGEPRPLLTIKIPERFWYGSFTWTPDSRRILAVRSRPRGPEQANEMLSEIWQVPVDGSAPVKIDFPETFVQGLRLNRDGKTVAFHVPHWKTEIWVLQNFL